MENKDFDGINAACRALEEARARAVWNYEETSNFMVMIIGEVVEKIPDETHPLRIRVKELGLSWEQAIV